MALAGVKHRLTRPGATTGGTAVTGRDLSSFQSAAPEAVAVLPATAGRAAFRRHWHQPPQAGGTLISGGTGIGWPGGTKQNGSLGFANGASAGTVKTIGWRGRQEAAPAPPVRTVPVPVPVMPAVMQVALKLRRRRDTVARHFC